MPSWTEPLEEETLSLELLTGEKSCNLSYSVFFSTVVGIYIICILATGYLIFATHIFEHELTLCYHRMAPEVIACDEQPDATYDNRV